jgi:hypothetical protein
MMSCSVRRDIAPDNVDERDQGEYPILSEDRQGCDAVCSLPGHVISASLFSIGQQHGGTRTWQQVRCFGSIR